VGFDGFDGVIFWKGKVDAWMIEVWQGFVAATQ